jgi:hypothetical protein
VLRWSLLQDGTADYDLGQSLCPCAAKKPPPAAVAEYYREVGHRSVVVRGAIGTHLGTVQTREADFIYVDPHNKAFVDRVPVPVDLKSLAVTVAMLVLASRISTSGARSP